MRYLRAECENGHGQDIRFERPPVDVPTVGGITVSTLERYQGSTVSSKAGTHPIYIDTEDADPELFCALIRTTSSRCGFCGGRVEYGIREE